ncbi:MAG: hypothetical protein KGH53_02035 [Candidatus Micrarchaeota archaeon]|nr:hypothetical protein [Candidatus Micrarchaeota archaeon]
MGNFSNLMVVFLMLLSMPLAFAQYGGGGGTTYPNCATCPSGTFVSNNAPTYWNCYGSGSLCTYTGVSTTSTAPTTSTSVVSTAPTTSVNNTSGGAKPSNTPATTTVATTVATTVPSVTPTYPNCNTCPSGTYISNNAPTYWNCYGSGSLCTYTGSSGSYSSAMAGLSSYAYGAIGLIAVIAIILLAMMKAPLTRLTIIGVALILIGTVAWLYGDYGAGSGYILYGAIGVIVGWIIWLYADKELLGNKMVGLWIKLGAFLTLVGTAIWLYGDYYRGVNPTYIWAGVALILIGTIIWLFGDNKIGAFETPKTK